MSKQNSISLPPFSTCDQNDVPLQLYTECTQNCVSQTKPFNLSVSNATYEEGYSCSDYQNHVHGVSSTANMPHCENGVNCNSNNNSDNDDEDDVDFVNREYINSEEFVFDTLFETIKDIDSNHDDEMFDSSDDEADNDKKNEQVIDNKVNGMVSLESTQKTKTYSNDNYNNNNRQCDVDVHFFSPPNNGQMHTSEPKNKWEDHRPPQLTMTSNVLTNAFDSHNPNMYNADANLQQVGNVNYLNERVREAMLADDEAKSANCLTSEQNNSEMHLSHISHFSSHTLTITPEQTRANSMTAITATATTMSPEADEGKEKEDDVQFALNHSVSSPLPQFVNTSFVTSNSPLLYTEAAHEASCQFASSTGNCSNTQGNINNQSNVISASAPTTMLIPVSNPSLSLNASSTNAMTSNISSAIVTAPTTALLPNSSITFPTSQVCYSGSSFANAIPVNYVNLTQGQASSTELALGNQFTVAIPITTTVPSTTTSVATATAAAVNMNMDDIPQDPELRSNLFICGLAPEVDDEALRSFFGVYGEIESAKVMLDIRTGQSRCIAFVKYKEVTCAERALVELNGANFKNHHITIRVANSKAAYLPGNPTNKTFVRNVPLSVSRQELHTYFSQFGEITDISIHADTAFGGRANSHDLSNGANSNTTGVDIANTSTIQSSSLTSIPNNNNNNNNDNNTSANNTGEAPENEVKASLEPSISTATAPAEADSTCDQTNVEQSNDTQDENKLNIVFITFTTKEAAAEAAAATHKRAPFPQCHGVPLLAKVAEDSARRVERLARRFRPSNPHSTNNNNNNNNSSSSYLQSSSTIPLPPPPPPPPPLSSQSFGPQLHPLYSQPMSPFNTPMQVQLNPAFIINSNNNNQNNNNQGSNMNCTPTVMPLSAFSSMSSASSPLSSSIMYNPVQLSTLSSPQSPFILSSQMTGNVINNNNNNNGINLTNMYTASNPSSYTVIPQLPLLQSQQTQTQHDMEPMLTNQPTLFNLIPSSQFTSAPTMAFSPSNANVITQPSPFSPASSESTQATTLTVMPPFTVAAPMQQMMSNVGGYATFASSVPAQQQQQQQQQQSFLYPQTILTAESTMANNQPLYVESINSAFMADLNKSATIIPSNINNTMGQDMVQGANQSPQTLQQLQHDQEKTTMTATILPTGSANYSTLTNNITTQPVSQDGQYYMFV